MAKAKVISDIDALILSAENHGDESVDHQIGDLERAVVLFWSYLSPEAQEAAMNAARVEGLLDWVEG